MKKAIFAVVALVMAGVVTSCVSSSASSEVEIEEIKAVEVVYKEIPYAELDDAVRNVNSHGQGFIVEAYLMFIKTSTGFSFYLSDSPNGMPSQTMGIHTVSEKYSVYVTPHQFEIYDDQLYLRIDPSKKYKIHLGFYYERNEGYGGPYKSSGHLFIDKIEGLRTPEEAAAIEARQKAEADAKKKAQAAAKEAKVNPDKLNRAAYKEITVEDFSFDMVAGKLAAGTKVAFKARFLAKPTGTSYYFHNIDTLITLSTKHNFIRNIPDRYFRIYEDYRVKIYVTVKKPGQMGECSVDIVEWEQSSWTEPW